MILEDMLDNRVRIDLTHRGDAYVIYYCPGRYNDTIANKLKTAQGEEGFDSLNPYLSDLLVDWEIDRIARDSEGRPLSIDGTILTDRTRQAPKLERLPINNETLSRLSQWLRAGMVKAIQEDLKGSVATPGNTSGISDSTPQVGNSGAHSAGDAAIREPSSPMSLTTTGLSRTPALVTVRPLESRNHTDDFPGSISG